MRAHRRRAFMVVLITVLAGFALGLGFSPLLAVRNVIVCAPDRALAAEVKSHICVAPGTSTLFCPMDQVTAQARACPRVGEVSVRREAPNVLRVEVTPRTPFAVLADAGDAVASRDGALLCRDARAPAALPRLRGVCDPRLAPGATAAGERWDWALEILLGATKAGLREGVEVDLSDLYQIRVQTADGVKATLGNVNDLTRKMAILGRTLDQLRAGGAQVSAVDVSTPGRPLWKLR